MFALPFVFVTFVINFPAGLIVYWITTNVWTIVQQLLVSKLYPKPEPLDPPRRCQRRSPRVGSPPRRLRSPTATRARRPSRPRTGQGGAGLGRGERRADAKAPPPLSAQEEEALGRRR